MAAVSGKLLPRKIADTAEAYRYLHWLEDPNNKPLFSVNSIDISLFVQIQVVCHLIYCTF